MSFFRKADFKISGVPFKVIKEVVEASKSESQHFLFPILIWNYSS